jgi:predicted membrane chloride channel (bestrophin family)
LTPARTCGNLAVVLLVFLVWFVVKIVRMKGWHVFSPVFIVGTPVIGLGILIALYVRYAAGLAEFQRFAEAVTPAQRPAEAAPSAFTPPANDSEP